MPVVIGCIVPHPPVMIPEIGGQRANDVAATQRGMHQLASRMAVTRPETIVVISPHGQAHHSAMGVLTASTSFGDFSMWGAAGLNFEFRNDLDFVEALQAEARHAGVPLKTIGEMAYELDHGVLVPIYFLTRGMDHASLVPLTFSWLSAEAHYAFGQALGRAAERSGKRVAVVASGDLSHRLTIDAPAGFDPDGQVFDQAIVQIVRKWDTQALLGMDRNLLHHAGECGYRSVVILFGAMDGLKVEPTVLSYEGPFGVGYMVASVELKAATSEQSMATVEAPVMHPVVMLAKKTVESFVSTGHVGEPEYTCPEMKERAGVFVSLKKGGELRGCIGTFEPTRQNVAEEIMQNAVSAATRDPRFLPVRVNELPDLTYSVDILSAPEPIDSLEQLDPRRYGVIVLCGERRGLLLPDLEGVDTAEEQVDIARRKASIGRDEPVALFRFEVRRFH